MVNLAENPETLGTISKQRLHLLLIDANDFAALYMLSYICSLQFLSSQISIIVCFSNRLICILGPLTQQSITVQ
jgi:hypothetical protein